MVPRRRRSVLRGVLAGLAGIGAGCANVTLPGETEDSESQQVTGAARPPVAQLQMVAGDNSEIGHYFVDSPLRYRDPPEEYVVRWTVENGSTMVDAEFPSTRGQRPVKYDGSVYQISYEVVDERPATRYFWNLEPTDQGSGEETVRFDELPRLDRRKFRLMGLADGAYGERTPLDIGATFKYANEDRDESALVPSPEHPIIVWGPDRRARFSIRKTNGEDATLKTYRYTADQLAPTVAAYGRQLRDRYAFELSGLSDAEQDIVEEATSRTHGYTVEREGSVPEAFDSLIENFQEHEAVEYYDEGGSGKYLTTYDGQIYKTELTDRRNDVSEGSATPTE